MKKSVLILLLVSALHAGAQSNYCLSFNGSTSYVQVNYNSALDLSATFTLEAWIYPTGPGENSTEGGIIINKENSYEIARFADGSIEFAMSAGGDGSWSWINTGLTAPLNQWSQVALVKNGATVTVYLNGAASYTNSSMPATLTANTQNLRIANRSNLGEHFAGYIDEVRIWNIARAQSDIKSNLFNKNLSNSAGGLVAYYRMNEGSGSNTANSCTNTSGLDGTLINSPAWQSSPVQFSGNALNFDGSNDVVNIPDNSSLHIASAITLEAWCYATKNSGIQDVISKSSSSTNTGYIFPRTDDGWAHAVFYLYIGGWKVLSASYPSLNTWHHLAATYDGATMKIYIDGVLVASQAQTGNIATNTNVLALGNQTGYPEYFGGSADEFRVWNVARTQAEIQSDMVLELDPVTATGLVSYYTNDQGIANGTNTGLVTLPDMKGNNNGTLTSFALSGTSSNFVPQYTGLGILPLQWLGFTARAEGKQVLLNWSIADQINTSEFIIQRSGNSIDWTSIDSLWADGSSNNSASYNYTDAHPYTGINFYRILEKSIDGRINYSEVKQLRFSQINSVFSILNNPVQGGLLRVQMNQTGILSLYNYNGSLLWKKETEPGIIVIDISKYARSIYLLQSGEQTQKVLIQ